MECKYHKILEELYQSLLHRVESHYEWPYFEYWLGDESYLGNIYKEKVEEILEEPLTEGQKALLEKKGENLETRIHKWCSTWKTNNPELQNQRMPITCLRVKIYQYLLYQLNKADMIAIIGNPC